MMEKMGTGPNPFEGLRGKNYHSLVTHPAIWQIPDFSRIHVWDGDFSLWAPILPSRSGSEQLLKKHNLSPSWSFSTDPEEGAKDADVIYTDVWVSMGCEEESQGRLESMTPYQVNDGLFALTKDNCPYALYACPSWRRVTQSVLNSERAILLTKLKIVCICKNILAALSKLNS